MSLRTDHFIQIMLYGELSYGSSLVEAPAKPFNIFSDGTMSYENKNGLLREIEVIEEQPGTLNVKITDVRNNDLINVFSMHYINLDCGHCRIVTIHARKGERYYCTTCGTYNTSIIISERK